jgi:tetratricopeptide (TPR) repeat protein
MKYLLLTVLCLAVLQSCSHQTKLPYRPAELLSRVNNLYPKEFQAQELKFKTAVTALNSTAKNTKALLQLASVYMQEARVTGNHPYYYPATLNALDECLRIDVENPEARLLRTSVLLSQHRFQEALQSAKDLTNNGVRTAYGMLCDAHVEMGNYSDAINAVDAMMANRPGLEAYSRVSYLREIYGDMQGALQAMKMAVAAGLPGTHEAAWTRTTYGGLLLQNGNIEEAKKQFQIAMLERSRFPFALAGIASVFKAQRKYSEAMLYLDSAVALMPEVAFVEVQAEIEFERGNTQAAMKHVEAIEAMLDEDEASGHHNKADRALIYAKFNYKLNEALRLAKQEITERPKNITTQYAMAFTLLKNNQAEKAEQYIQQALRTGTQDKNIHLCAAQIKQAAKRSIGITSR